MKRSLTTPLNLESFLLEEYKYASAYTLQMIKERGSMLTVYNASIALIVSIVVALPKIKSITIDSQVTNTALLTVVGVVHFLLFIRFAYLEKKYFYYQQKMNKIRELYIKNFANMLPEVKDLVMPIPTANVPFISPIWLSTFLFLIAASLCFSASSYYYTHNYLGALLIFLVSAVGAFKLSKTTTSN